MTSVTRTPTPVRFVLASASPARRRTLQRAGVEPEVMVSGVDEESVHANSAERLVLALAEAKAQAVARAFDGEGLVLGCDSLLELDGEALGKPGTADAAIARWRTMRGRSGVLVTGHALLQVVDREVVGKVVRAASTTVHFAEPSDAEVSAYVGTGEPLDVAGAFTVDGLGGWFVDRIEGDHHNVVGLSLPLLRRMLGDLGFGLADLGYPR